VKGGYFLAYLGDGCSVKKDSAPYIIRNADELYSSVDEMPSKYGPLDVLF
jgi:hypothetical protein